MLLTKWAGKVYSESKILNILGRLEGSVDGPWRLEITSTIAEGLSILVGTVDKGLSIPEKVVVGGIVRIQWVSRRRVAIAVVILRGSKSWGN